MEEKLSDDSVLDQLAVETSEHSSENNEVALSKLLLPVSDQHKHGKIKQKPKAKKHYVTDKAVKPDDKVRGPEDEAFPFRYPKDLAVLAHGVMTKAWRKDERIKQLKLKCVEKTNYRGRQPKDLQRLYVEEPPKDSMKTACDINPQYFKVVQSKPDKINMKDYIQTMRDSLRINIVNGYLEDDILLLDENLLLEQKMLDIIRENFQKYVNIFEEFLYNDHKSSKQLLEDSEEIAREAYDEYQEYMLVAKKLSALRSTLFITEEKWRTSKIYQKFLNTVSPASWRDGEIKNEPQDEFNIFGTYRQSIGDKYLPINEMIEVFYKESRNESPPKIYFTKPDQLLEVFRLLEMQNLNALLLCEELAVPMIIVKEGLSNANKFFTKQIEEFQHALKKMEASILWEEDHVTYSRELAKELLDSQFRKTVMDDDVLNLQVFVEDVYESKIGENAANLGILEMMIQIESKYYDELLCMDKIPSLDVASLEITCFQEEVRVMQLAERATKQIAEQQREVIRLNKSYDPPFKKPGGKEVKKRSPVKREKGAIAITIRNTTEDDFFEYFGSTENFEKASDSNKDIEEKINR